MVTTRRKAMAGAMLAVCCGAQFIVVLDVSIDDGGAIVHRPT
ncbi:MAG TPA: hypothetical protein VMF65_18470 [Acidimicrobiales bacterium]|nr:hypothetical protein [Acidimicrobiales bacterium]